MGESSGVESSGVEVDVEVEEEVEYVEEYVEEEVDEGEEAEEEREDEGEGDSAENATAAEELSPASAEGTGKQTSEGAKEPQPEVPTSSPARTEQPSTTVASGVEAEAAGGTNSSAGVDLVSLEAQAAKVAAEVSQVASKLTAGLRNAFGASGGSGGGAAEAAGASLSKLAGGLTSWWGSLDPQPAPVRDETAERIAQSNKASGELQQLFGLSAEENLVEHFRCKLLQTYACSHNSHTPAIQMAFQGTLYVTDRHTCFSVEERGRKLPFKVPHASITRATRQRPSRKGDLSDILKLELSNGTWLAFKDFDSGSALDSALALVEHLVEDG